MKKIVLNTSLALCIMLSLITIPAFAAETDGFADIEGHWAESSIQRWTGYDVVDGKGNGVFDPDGVMTRGEFAKVLATAMGLEKEADVSTFTDLEEGAWYVSPIAQCVEAGILNGVGNNTMSPLAPISREQAFTMIARALGIAPVEKELPFADGNTVSDYALGYVAAMNEYGWVNGVSGGGFAPLDDITRGSVMSLLDRIITVYSNTDKAEVTCDGGVVLLTGDNTTLTGKANLVVVTGQNVNLDKGQFEQLIVLSDDGKIVANKDAAVEHLQLDGNGNTVSGTGTVKDVLANGNNNTISTKNTKVIASEEATGTKAGNKNVAAGGSVITPSTSTTGGGGSGGTVTPPQENQAQKVVTDAWAALGKSLEGITGYDQAQLVTATQNGNQLILTFNVDAIKAGESAFTDDMLTGLATRLKAALDQHFGEYVLTVANQEVYNKGSFQNTALKNALFTVSQGFFEYLSKMEADADGVYTYKTVAAKATGTDSYDFNICVKLKGEDVAKVQKLAKTLANHLAMEKLTSDTIKERYGITVNENEAFVITMEMPDALMKKGVEIAGGNGVAAQNTFDSVTVGKLLDKMAGLDLNDILGSGASEINSVLTTVNSNANVVNKVLSKLTVSVKETEFVTEAGFVPGKTGNAYKDFMSGVIGMTSDGIKNMTPAAFKVAQEGPYKDVYYAVPVTVNIDLKSSMGFTAQETVVVVLHIDFSAYANTETQ